MGECRVRKALRAYGWGREGYRAPPCPFSLDLRKIANASSVRLPLKPHSYSILQQEHFPNLHIGSSQPERAKHLFMGTYKRLIGQEKLGETSLPTWFFHSMTPKVATSFPLLAFLHFMRPPPQFATHQGDGAASITGSQELRELFMTAVIQGMIYYEAVRHLSRTPNPTRKHQYSFTNRTQHFYSLIDFLPVLIFAITREERKNTVQHC